MRLQHDRERCPPHSRVLFPIALRANMSQSTQQHAQPATSRHSLDMPGSDFPEVQTGLRAHRYHEAFEESVRPLMSCRPVCKLAYPEHILNSFELRPRADSDCDSNSKLCRDRRQIKLSANEAAVQCENPRVVI